MSIDRSDFKYSYSFTWIIENLLLCPLKFKESLLSPKFTLENLGATAWRIMLFPRGSEDSKYVACYLQRVSDASKLESVNINFRFVLLDHSFNDIHDSVCYNIAFEVNQYWGFATFFRRELVAELKTSVNQKLTLRCDMSPCKNDIANALINERKSLERFSLNIISLYQNGRFYDLILQCDGKHFKAHQAIINARAPKLAKKLKLDFVFGHITHRDIDNITCDVLHQLLYYLYSGSLMPCRSLQSQLWFIAERYEIFDLKKKLVTYPKHYTGRTCMKIEYKSLAWHMTNSYNESADMIKVIPLEQICVRDIIIRCSLGSSSFGLQRIHISMGFANFDENQPISVSCKMSAVDDDDDTLLDQFEDHNYFDTGNEWNFVLFTNTDNKNHENYPVKRFTVCCDLSICYGERTTFIESSWIFPDKSVPEPYDSSILSRDLGKLRANSLFSDVSIVADNIMFPAHRAILAVRSPVFEKMFQHNMLEKQTGIVTINDIRAHAIRPLLVYIYTGRIDTSYCDFFSLYSAADKYEVLTLRDNCTNILITRLTVENSCRALLTGYLHDDYRLMMEAKKYIRLNASKVKKTLAWNFLVRKFNELANKIFEPL